MSREPQGAQASRLRQRKFELVRRVHLPEDLLPGSLSLSHLRCGKPTCHCAEGSRHPVWPLTCLALIVERLYRLRHLHRGAHPARTAIDLLRLLQLGLAAPAVADSS